MHGQYKFNNLFDEQYPKLIVFKVYCRVKTGKVEVNCYQKMVLWIVTLTNHVIDEAGFTLRGAPDTLEIFAKSSCQI